MKFPYSEAEVVALAEAMISGYAAHAVDFPSVDPLPLGTSLTDYKTARDAQEDASAQAQLATGAKNGKLSELVETMKSDLKLSEVDTTADPTKLTQIGWGPKSEPSPTVPPNMPVNLTLPAKITGSVIGNGQFYIFFLYPVSHSLFPYFRQGLASTRSRDRRKTYSVQ